MTRSYHILTDDWEEHYRYDPDEPPLWDADCSFYSTSSQRCPSGHPEQEDELVPFRDPDDGRLLQAHAACLDAAYGPDGWTRAEIPYDEDDWSDEL